MKRVTEKGIDIDYVTFLGDGEPTLYLGIGTAAKMIKDELGLRVAVLTNGSMLWRDDVFSDLLEFDYVSIKIDAVNVDLWKAINRPHASLNLFDLIESWIEFSKVFRGTLTVETMVVSGINDDVTTLRTVLEVVKRMRISRYFISTPTRPPAEPWVRPIGKEKAFELLQEATKVLGEKVSLLVYPETGSFGGSRSAIEDLLSICRTHPLRLEQAVEILAREFDDPKQVLQKLIEERKVRVVRYEGIDYIVSMD